MYVEGIASGGGSDWFYIAVIHAPNGADVHVDDGDEDIDATVASGNYIGIPVHNQSSTYTITVTMNGLSAPDQTFTTGTTSGQMVEKTFEFAEIDIEYDSAFQGQTATVSDGTHSTTVTIPAVGTSLVLHVPYTGNWRISAVDPVSGDTFYTSPDPIVISSLSQTVSCHLYVIPDGKTVTPTDDIQTWLMCANIKDKSYTTLAEVLEDEDTLRRLLTDDNAIDYLKRSTTWADVGGKVPKMTDNTHPSGEAIRINGYGSEADNFSAYCSFNENNSDGACVNNDGIIAYHFTSAITIGKVRLFTMNNANIPSTVQVVASHDGTNWVNIGSTNSTPNQSTEYTFDVPGDTDYEYWGIKGSGASLGYWRIAEIQFYELSIPSSELAMSYIGAYDYAADELLSDVTWKTAICESEYVDEVLNVSVPTMTSNTAPEGKASASSINSSTYDAYKAFNNDSTTMWCTQDVNPPHWLEYDFASAVAIHLVEITKQAAYDYTLEVQAYDDDTSSWVPIKSSNIYSGVMNKIILNNNTEYTKYRLYITNTTQYASSKMVAKLVTAQFYGREAAGVQTWLKAADLDRPYTTLAEVLADRDALAALMSSHDAVDYLVTVKSWIDTITSDETAMRYIGRRNYAADTLLADEDWCAGIASSTYSEYVLNAKVPILTSNADGAFGGGESVANTAYFYCAFNGSDGAAGNIGWLPGTADDTKWWVGYDFTRPVVVHKLGNYSTMGTGSPLSFTIRGSNDGTNWTDIQTFTDHSTTKAWSEDYVVNNTAYRYYSVKWNDVGNWGSSGKWNSGYGAKYQFYGRQDVTESDIEIFSAASDTVYYLDSSNNPVTVATTDTSGKATIQKSLLPNGTYTLYSTVAEDPDNLSNSYSKQVTITDETMDVMVMPDGSVYWYGYGDYLRSSGAGTVTKNTNYLRNTTGVSQTLSVFFDTSVKKYSKASLVFDGYSNWSYNWNGDNVAYTTGKRKATANRIDESVFGGMQNGTNTNVYAVYCED